MGIEEYSGPFVYVALRPDGSRLSEMAQGNGRQAGVVS